MLFKTKRCKAPAVRDYSRCFFDSGIYAQYKENKIAFTYNGQLTETMPFVMVKSGDGYTTELLDSDEDQVPDAFENVYGTDNAKSDSDGDGVSDYEEIMFLDSDPAVYDSVTSGISDANADSDNDGLSNRLEIDNNCNPLYDDSDEDGLLDGEEIHTYGTDPLNPDTDGDSLKNNEEINWESPLIRKTSVTSVADLPTLKECIDTVSRNGLTYVEPGLERLKKYSPSTYAECCNKRILPISSDPLSEDGDGDGLLDGQAQEFHGERIAPVDQNKLKYDGPKNLWKTHIETAKDETIPRTLDKWYGVLPVPDLSLIFEFYGKYIVWPHVVNKLGQILTICGIDTEDYDELLDEQQKYLFAVFHIGSYINLTEPNSGVEGLTSLAFEGYLLQEAGYIHNKELGKTLAVSALYQLENIFNGGDINFDYLKLYFLTVGQYVMSDEARADLGSRALNFKVDNRNVIHSQPRQWQAIGGYNNLYDEIFHFAVRGNMDREKFSFTLNDKEYILWAWRGDYLNLGAGAEVGIYERPLWLGELPKDHHFTNYGNSMPMELYLYDYEGNSSYENIFSWKPDEKQWWITAFNPQYLRGDVDAKKEVMICCVDFTGKEDMFEAFYEKMSALNGEDENKYLIFDEEKKEVWICWYEEGVLP